MSRSNRYHCAHAQEWRQTYSSILEAEISSYPKADQRQSKEADNMSH